jgi:threonine/homoserine/homoserine lactone efflux protein
MIEAIGSLIVASALLLGTPGPAPLSLAATGAVFGFRRGFPFLIGILAGLAVAIVLGSLGVVGLFEAFPATRLTVQIIGGLYICYVALKVASAPRLSSHENTNASAPRFVDGIILNFLNPKAYAAFLAIFSQFMLPLSNVLESTIVTALLAFGIAVVVDVAWLALGGVLRPIFEAPGIARITRVILASLMVIAVVFASIPAS